MRCPQCIRREHHRNWLSRRAFVEKTEIVESPWCRSLSLKRLMIGVPGRSESHAEMVMGFEGGNGRDLLPGGCERVRSDPTPSAAIREPHADRANGGTGSSPVQHRLPRERPRCTLRWISSFTTKEKSAFLSSRGRSRPQRVQLASCHPDLHRRAVAAKSDGRVLRSPKRPSSGATRRLALKRSTHDSPRPRVGHGTSKCPTRRRGKTR